MPEHYYNHSRRSHRSLADPLNTSPYPGISPYGHTPELGDTGFLPSLDVTEVADAALVPAAEEVTTKAGGLLGGLGNLGNLANMEQIKGFVDRMGGIEGIVSSMGKVQKVMSSFQQMAPMVKLVMGTFGKGKGSSGALAAEEDAAMYRPKRRRKKSPASGSRKKSSRSTSKRTTSSRKRRRKY
ncbi:tyrosine protein kinase [Paenibacillus agri]|uniref:Tyrosine protein kinase n=1 Tax=Paenibacillus agri TaxID=2744309 RepID=A0A850EJL2_9BACL|nr:tyrosine protein kinase [Paenibacillus agri]NUU61128.1 tyrosine protein kinase [Paenibacillus agri]